MPVRSPANGTAARQHRLGGQDGSPHAESAGGHPPVAMIPTLPQPSAAAGGGSSPGARADRPAAAVDGAASEPEIAPAEEAGRGGGQQSHADVADVPLSHNLEVELQLLLGDDTSSSSEEDEDTDADAADHPDHCGSVEDSAGGDLGGPANQRQPRSAAAPMTRRMSVSGAAVHMELQQLLGDDSLSPLPTTIGDALEDLLGMLSSDDEDS